MRVFSGLFVGLALAGSTAAGALMIAAPAIARPATISTEDTDGVVNIRAAANARSRVKGELGNGRDVEVLSVVETDDQQYWYYISADRYMKGDRQTLSGGWVDGSLVRFNPDDRRYATLRGDQDERINVRSAASLKSRVLHQGLVGNLVVIDREMRDDRGDRWYYVEFPSRVEGQAKGWVRGDLLSIWPEGCIVTCPDN